MLRPAPQTPGLCPRRPCASGQWNIPTRPMRACRTREAPTHAATGLCLLEIRQHEFPYM